jgi:hypothetical protein
MTKKDGYAKSSPAIHVFLPCEAAKDVDARDNSAFTRVFDTLCAGIGYGGITPTK